MLLADRLPDNLVQLRGNRAVFLPLALMGMTRFIQWLVPFRLPRISMRPRSPGTVAACAVRAPRTRTLTIARVPDLTFRSGRRTRVRVATPSPSGTTASAAFMTGRPAMSTAIGPSMSA